MMTIAKEKNPESDKSERPLSNTAVQELSQFLAPHFQRLEDFFKLMERSQGNGNCHMCEFSSMGKFFLQKFKEETEQVRQAIEKEFGTIHIARQNQKGDILGIITVPPASPGTRERE